jgi:DNA-binding FadR family transcriptional regulator
MAPVLEKLQRQPAYKALANYITREIMEGRMKPGEQLPTEAELVAQLGASRSTIREGIRLLEETGLINRRNGKRLLVSSPSSDAIGVQLERAIVLNQVSFREVWEAAMVFEPAAATAAASNITRPELEALLDNVRRTERSCEAGESLLELDIAFHALIARAAHNRVLLLTREPLQRLFYPAFATILECVPPASKRLVDAHRAILEGLASGDAAQAQAWMVKHMEDFRRGWHAAGLDLEQPVHLPQSAR